MLKHRLLKVLNTSIPAVICGSIMGQGEGRTAPSRFFFSKNLFNFKIYIFAYLPLLSKEKILVVIKIYKNVIIVTNICFILLKIYKYLLIL